MRTASPLADGSMELIALAMNGAGEALTFVLPTEGLTFERLIDSADPEAEPAPVGEMLELPGGAAVILRAVGEAR